MNRTPIRLGPLALLLTVIAIAMTTLGILTFSTSKADLAMREKFRETVKTRYALEKEACEELAGTASDSLTREKDGYILEAETDSEGASLVWRIHRQWDYDDLNEELWDGN
ncbi:MAG: hypothetical protein IJG64_02305 [Oscillospiraceae bacterium]|nr:hypothetical protein [Oscillospiraceae bacterium]